MNELIRTSNHILGGTIWDKLLECIFENFQIARVKRGQFKFFKNHERNLSQKSLKTNK